MSSSAYSTGSHTRTQKLDGGGVHLGEEDDDDLPLHRAFRDDDAFDDDDGDGDNGDDDDDDDGTSTPPPPRAPPLSYRVQHAASSWQLLFPLASFPLPSTYAPGG
jgi:hypothetical protein